MTQDSLLERAQKNDHEALAALHDQLYPVVYRYVHFRVDDDKACEDITSEVFLRFLTALRQSNRPVEDARAWMLGTASNLVHDYYRLKYRRAVESIDKHETLVAPQMTEAVVDRKLVSEELRQMIQHLTPDQQNVLALRFSQELSLELTAQIIGKSVNAVKVLQFRALATLRRLMVRKPEE
jgi:RNA polymerase sigma-70 factor (ECF subfamily)